MTPEQRLAELNLTLLTVSPPAANYVSWQLFNNLLYISGQLPMRDGKLQYIGRVGADISVEEAAQAAELCTLNILAQAKAALGELGRIRQTLRLGGFVQCVDAFTQQPAVLNGASNLLVAVLGDAGKHARVAVGTNALPFGVAVEVEALFAIG